MFKALADPGRRLLLDRLYRGERANARAALRAPGDDPPGGDEAPQGAGRGVAGRPVWRGREKLHYLNPVPIHEIAERWIGKFERGRLAALADLKKHWKENRWLIRDSST